MIVIIQSKTPFTVGVNDVDSELVIASEINHHLLDMSIVGETK